MSNGNTRFDWIAHDVKADIEVCYLFPDAEEGRGEPAVQFTKGCTKITYTAEEWLELVGVVDECFAANGHPLDYSETLGEVDDG